MWYFLTRLGTKAQNRWWRALGHTARWLGLAGLATVAASKISALNKGPLSGPEKGKMEDALAAIDNATKNSPEGELGEFWKVKDGKSGWEWDGEEKSIIYAPMIAQGGLDGYWHIKIDGKKFGTTEESRFKWHEKKRRHFFVVGKDVTDATVIFNGTFNGEPVVPAKEYRIHRSDTATVAPEVKMPIAKEPEAFDEKDLPPSMNFLEGPKTFTFQRQSYTVNVNAAEGMITVNKIGRAHV